RLGIDAVVVLVGPGERDVERLVEPDVVAAHRFGWGQMEQLWRAAVDDMGRAPDVRVAVPAAVRPVPRAVRREGLAGVRAVGALGIDERLTRVVLLVVV